MSENRFNKDHPPNFNSASLFPWPKIAQDKESNNQRREQFLGGPAAPALPLSFKKTINMHAPTPIGTFGPPSNESSPSKTSPSRPFTRSVTVVTVPNLLKAYSAEDLFLFVCLL
jgi:hypothetical protein